MSRTKPGRGSGALPEKRSAERASTTCTLSSVNAMRTSSSIATAPTFISALNFFGSRLPSPFSSGRPSAFHFGKPPSRIRTFLAPKMPERPPYARRRIEAGAVIDDDGIAVADAKRAGRFAELLRAGQHVRQFGRMVADRIDVEKHRAGNVAGAVFGRDVALLSRRGIRAVDHDEVSVAQMLGKPIGRDQPAAGRGGLELSSGLSMAIRSRQRARSRDVQA